MELQDRLSKNHASEISALNAIVQLVGINSSKIGNIETRTASLSRTPNLLRSTGASNIAVICYSFSVANVGGADGILLGEVIKDGEVVSFDAGSLNNFYPAASITWDATGTEFIVTYNI